MTVLSYKDADGLAHWPDSVIGKEAYYGVEWDDFLTVENDTITAVRWIVPTGLTNMAESQGGNQSRIKLSADSAGLYKVVCEIDTFEGSETQLFIQEMWLKVA